MKTITLHRSSGQDSTGGKTKQIANGLLQSITTLWFLCARQAVIASRKFKDNSKISPDSPMIRRPKKLIASISNKAIKLRQRRNRTRENGNFRDDHNMVGDEGLWKREILMGDKCQPLDFSGVIYYDRDGKRTDEFPMRSPRASPLPNYVPKFNWVPPHER
uniref:uncharacterized protein LOC122610623 n=1 Tax=Erigeron canadensis TaxID=72917 RepID=UPI001CB8B869|nr:uncharacterized protein LOC122610623 [Erigeron canadensis]